MPHYTEIDLATVKDGLQMAAGVVQLWEAVKDSEDVQTIRNAIPKLATEITPYLKGLNTFLTQMDIDAIRQMEDAGIDRPHAVALRMRTSLKDVFGSAINGAAKVRKSTSR